MLYYYVGCKNESGTKKLTVTGPYPTTEAAVADVERVRVATEALFPNDQMFHWYQWVASHSETRVEGQLNDKLGFVPEL